MDHILQIRSANTGTVQTLAPMLSTRTHQLFAWRQKETPVLTGGLTFCTRRPSLRRSSLRADDKTKKRTAVKRYETWMHVCSAWISNKLTSSHFVDSGVFFFFVVPVWWAIHRQFLTAIHSSSLSSALFFLIAHARLRFLLLQNTAEKTLTC